MTNPVHILFHFVLIPIMLGRWSRFPLKWCTKSMIQIPWLPESSFSLFPEPHSAHSSSDSWAICVVCPDSPWSSDEPGDQQPVVWLGVISSQRELFCVTRCRGVLGHCLYKLSPREKTKNWALHSLFLTSTPEDHGCLLSSPGPLISKELECQSWLAL